MTAQSNFPINDLILRLAGGQRDGELIPVNTQKCFLGFEENSDQDAESSQCAIFRGPNGTAVRSYGDNLSVNGVPSTVHWLKEGDRIEFPNSITVEVAQLGWVEAPCHQHDAAMDEDVDPDLKCLPNNNEGADQRDSETECVDQQEFEMECVFDQQEPETECVDRQESETDWVDQPSTEPETCLNEHQSVDDNQPSIQNELRLEQLESQMRDIQSQVSQSDQRFDRLDQQLAALSEQISELFSLSEDNVAHPDHAEESFITLGNTEPPNELAQSEEVFMHLESSDSPGCQVGEEIANIRPASDFYSHLDDDDEKIISFDPESEANCTEASTADVEITDAPPELSNDAQDEIDPRLSEMERVFSSVLGEADPGTTEPAIEQTADEQELESFESPTHGLDERSDSSAGFTTTDGSESLEPGSLASQLLSDVLSEASQFDESEVEEVPEEPAAVTEPASQPGTSVADLLARMKAEGQWDGVPEEEDDNVPVTEPVVQSSVESVESAGPEGDVENYMSQLLNRMRGGVPETKVEPASTDAETEEPEPEKDSPANDFAVPVNPLKPEEFKPARKAQKIELSAMRELANSSSRSAVQASETIRRKELGYLQIGISVASFFMAIYYFFVNSKVFLDTGSVVGLICMGIAGFLGFRFYSNLREYELSEAITQKKSEKEPDNENAAETPAEQ